MSSSDPLIQALITDAEALKTAGISQGQAQAARAYYGQSAIRLMVGVFTAALSEAAALLGGISPEAQQFLSAKAAEFAQFAQPPTVVAVSPPTNAANVSTDDQIVLTFSSELDPADVTAACFYVQPTNGGQALGATVTYDGNKTVTINPTNGFSSGVEYTITVGASVRSKLGQPLGTAYTSTFTAA